MELEPQLGSKLAVGALAALAQDTRLAIYRLLVRHGPAGLAAGSIGDALNLAPATLSFHLRELSYSGLICARQQSRFIYYSADTAAMEKLIAYLAEIGSRKSVALEGLPAKARRLAPPIAKPVVRPKTRTA